MYLKWLIIWTITRKQTWPETGRHERIKTTYSVGNNSWSQFFQFSLSKVSFEAVTTYIRAICNVHTTTTCLQTMLRNKPGALSFMIRHEVCFTLALPNLDIIPVNKNCILALKIKRKEEANFLHSHSVKKQAISPSITLNLKITFQEADGDPKSLYSLDC